MWKSILSPPEQLEVFQKEHANKDLSGSKIQLLEERSEKLNGIALLTVGETAEEFEAFRTALYNLFCPSQPVPCYDLGHLSMDKSGKELSHAVDLCLESIIECGLVPVLIGGNDESLKGQYAAMKDLDQMVCLTSVSPSLLLGGGKNWVTDILESSTEYLYKFTHLAYQNYLSDPMSAMAMDRLNFDRVRLGELRNDIRIAEPFLRETDILHFDLSSLKNSEAPAQFPKQPNGLYSEDACQLMRYAGMGDHISGISMTGFTLSNEAHITSALLAQMLWHFWEGFGLRRNEEPSSESGNFTRFLVDLDEVEGGLVFWKSRQSGRWWIELPAPENRMLKKYTLLPSSYEDYEQALNGELPDRFMKAYSRLGID